MEYLVLFWGALVDLSNAMAPYIVFGLLFAGVLHELVPDALVTKHLGSDNVASVVKSTLFGIPLPVCSCGVIPLATSIKKSGASHGATLSFLISTPITGVDSILATYGMFGWAFTLYRVFTSMLMAMIAGILTNLFGSEPEPAPAPKAPAFSMAAPPKQAAPVGFSMASPQKEEESCCSSGCGCETEEKKRFAPGGALRYAFVTLLGDIAKPLFWGLIVGALITVAIPEDLGTLLAENSWLSYLIVIAVAVPMYVCATASLPIAAGLMLSGVSAGAAFVFLSAGPATNTVTIGVVKKMLGTRALAIYLGTITVASVVFGLMLDWLFIRAEIDPKALVHLHEEAGIIAVASSLLLWGLVLYFIAKPWFAKKEACCSGESCGCEK
ncbi:SO_0444 family Cu/Zn efflux transporter [Sulfurimonas sp. HSL1-2]|uniref:SO_0444 family Cu/Zn efflux transporter n=1 Tax=Thiomicrolovo zhangzhouensis TaxID=3131933 RepID=UPI0031F742D0